MTNQPAEFESDRRIHVALAVTDLACSIDFYKILLGQEPTKIRDRYAKFEATDPSLNLALNEPKGSAGPSNSVAHFGIQVKSTEAVLNMLERFKSEGLKTEVEKQSCYPLRSC